LSDYLVIIARIRGLGKGGGPVLGLAHPNLGKKPTPHVFIKKEGGEALFEYLIKINQTSS
jgi:hypothetical protein